MRNQVDLRLLIKRLLSKKQYEMFLLQRDRMPRIFDKVMSESTESDYEAKKSRKPKDVAKIGR